MSASRASSQLVPDERSVRKINPMRLNEDIIAHSIDQGSSNLVKRNTVEIMVNLGADATPRKACQLLATIEIFDTYLVTVAFELVLRELLPAFKLSSPWKYINDL